MLNTGYTVLALRTPFLLIGFNYHKPVPAARSSKPHVSCDGNAPSRCWKGF